MRTVKQTVNMLTAENPVYAKLDRYLRGLKPDQIVSTDEVTKKIGRSEKPLRPSRLPSRFAVNRHKDVYPDPKTGEPITAVFWGSKAAIADLKRQLGKLNQGDSA